MDLWPSQRDTSEIGTPSARAAQHVGGGLTLLATGKITKFPIVLVGSGYWNGLLGWLKETMLAEGNIGPEELELFQVADHPAEILKIIKTAHAGMSHT